MCSRAEQSREWKRQGRAMKNLYHRKAGKVHPSSASASAANSCRGDAYSVLRLLPVAIATLKATLPPEDQEVLAYLIARSPDVLPLQETETKKNRSGAKNGKLLPASAGIDSEQEDQETPALGGGGGGGGTGTASLSSPSPFRSSSSPFTRFAEADALLRRNPSGRAGGSVLKEDLKNKRKASQNSLRNHRLSFDCSCFQCYMGFWSRWDASPNREIIHKAIDLFEDNMAASAAAEAVETSSSAKGGACKGKNRKSSKSSKEEKNFDSSKAINPPWAGHAETTDMQENAKGESAGQDLDAAADKEAKSERSILVWAEHEESPKSKQIVPLAFEENDGEVRQAEQQQKQEARVGACPLGGRSLMRRMFPDIMGFVADHLWTAWSSPVRATNA